VTCLWNRAPTEDPISSFHKETERFMNTQDLEKAFAKVLGCIKHWDDGAAYVPLARKLEEAVMARRAVETDFDRYLSM